MSRQVRSSRPPTIQLLVTFLMLMVLVAGCAGPAATTAPQPAAPTQPAAPAQPTATTAAAPAEPTATTAAAEPTATTAAAEPTAQAFNDKDYSPDIKDPTSPVTITFASWVHGQGDIWEQLAERFHKIHPNITIEFQDIPAEEMHDKLVTQVAANNPPDTAYVDASSVGDFASRGSLVSLDNFVTMSQSIDLKDYVPAFLKSAQFEGKLYGLPIDGESTGLFYRTDRFQEAGLDPAKPPKTWAELKDYADKLTNKDQKKYGYIVFAPEAAYYFYPFLWQAGADTINPQNPSDVVWDSPQGQEAADFYVSLAKDSPPDFLNSNSWDGRVAFANGDVAMYMAGAWFAGTLLSEFPDSKDKWAAAPLPTKDQSSKCATTIAGDNLVVFKGSKNPEAAYKWLEFVSTPENMALLNVGTPEAPATLLPPRLSLLNDPKTYEGRPFLKGFADNMKCAVVSDVVQPRYGEMEQFLNEALGSAFYGKTTGKEAVIQSAKEAEDLLKK